MDVQQCCITCVRSAQVRDRDKAAAAAERRVGMRANMAFLEQQEADFKSGGQGGMGKFGKKRKRR